MLSLLSRRAPRALPLLRSSYSSSHGPSYDPPSGRLFGEAPLAPNTRRVKEDWENIYIFGMGGGFALAAVLIYYKPDTSLEGWATKEAEKRLAAKGETPSYVRS